MIRILLGLLLLVPQPSHADQGPLPAFYDVVDVAHDDVLNIRASASSQAEIVGELAPTQKRIEVTERSADGRWGRINDIPSTGWVFMRYLARQAAQDGREVPTPIGCYGTEPSWSFDLEDTQGELKIFGGDTLRLYHLRKARSSNLVTKYAVSGRTDEADVHAILTRRSCSDGMSDRHFGLEIDLMFVDPDQGIGLLSGCCSLK